MIGACIIGDKDVHIPSPFLPIPTEILARSNNKAQEIIVQLPGNAVDTYENRF